MYIIISAEFSKLMDICLMELLGKFIKVKHTHVITNNDENMRYLYAYKR